MAWCFHGGLFSFTKKSSLFQILVKCGVFVGIPCPRWRIRMSSTSSKVERSSTINDKLKSWQTYVVSSCHLAVKQYQLVWDIFQQELIDLCYESFFQVNQLWARSSSKAHIRSWLPKRPSELKGDLSKHSPIKSYQSLPGRYVPSIGSSTRSSDDTTGPYLTSCKAAMVQRRMRSWVTRFPTQKRKSRRPEL